MLFCPFRASALFAFGCRRFTTALRESFRAARVASRQHRRQPRPAATLRLGTAARPWRGPTALSIMPKEKQARAGWAAGLGCGVPAVCPRRRRARPGSAARRQKNKERRGGRAVSACGREGRQHATRLRAPDRALAYRPGVRRAPGAGESGSGVSPSWHCSATAQPLLSHCSATAQPAREAAGVTLSLTACDSPRHV